MSRLRIAAIVEGHGEIDAVPVLLRRYAQSMGLAGRIDVNPVIRQPASKLLSENEIERLVELAIRKIGKTGGILILLDSDGKCPAAYMPSVEKRLNDLGILHCAQKQMGDARTAYTEALADDGPAFR